MKDTKPSEALLRRHETLPPIYLPEASHRASSHFKGGELESIMMEGSQNHIWKGHACRDGRNYCTYLDNLL